MAKAKQKTKSKDKTRTVNFNNPKTMQVIQYMQIAENRISRDDLLQVGNKDILYQLKNNGYIKENAKGVFQGTNQLHSYMKKRDGSTFSKSNSIAHADAILKSAKLLPRKVMIEGRFQTGTDIQKAFHKIKQSKVYKERLNKEKEVLRGNLMYLARFHSDFQRSDETKKEKLQENINYRSTKDTLNRTMNILKGNDFSTPDYSVILNELERYTFYNNLTKYRDDNYKEQSKDYKIYSNAIEKLQGMITEDSYSIGIEIITEHYSTVSLEKHCQYERLANQTVIYLT